METHLETLCRGLARSVDVEVLAAAEGPRGTSETLDGVNVTRLPRLFNAASVPVCPGLFSALRTRRPDVVHLHIPNPLATLAHLACGGPAPVVATHHGDVIRQRLLWRLYEPLMRRTLDQCAAFIATNPAYIGASPVLSRYKEKVRVIPMGIPYEAYQRPGAGAAVREKYGDRLIVSVGRLIYYKGFEVLVDAMRTVRARLLILGEGPLRAALEDRARRAGVAGRVTILGGIDDLVPYYQAADVFALASTAAAESFGLVQLEAMACGKPIVNTALPTGVPFVSPDGVTGLTVPPGDAGALAAALERLLDDAALRERLGEAGRRRVRAEFGVDRMVRETLALYTEVAGR